jgi:hypothetical protein
MAFFKMVAWDARTWGLSLASVPPDQLGMTDTVRDFLGGDDPRFPQSCSVPPIPFFHQPAIVPIPEPSAFVLGLVGVAALLLFRRVRHCCCKRDDGSLITRNHVGSK